MALYVIECGGYLKIGYSDNPERRVAKLFQSGSRYTAPRAAYEARGAQRLVHVVEGASKQDEGMVHIALDEYAIGAEWFMNEPAVLDLVRGFKPDDIPEPIERPEGNAYHTLPYEERGGCNAGPILAAVAKRRAS